ncbi:MAG: glutathione S-transferase family protein [Myxococcota bacterium]|nr:glutathione S-transferase family protein [Myxococcota bacterium]
MDTLTLHAFGDNDRSGKVRWTCAELGIPVIERRLRFPEQRQEPYLSLNPLGAVPCVEYRGQTLGESTAICQWLAEEHGSALTRPVGHPQRLEYLWWISATSETCEVRLVDASVSKIGLLPPEVEAIQGRMVKRRIRALAAKAPEQGYLLGEFSLADIFLAYSVRLGRSLGYLDPELGAAWYQRVRARPAAQTARFFPE